MGMTYEFRPAKAAQRRMIVDACRRLTYLAPTSEYQYVGFGGLEFIDFIEFHRALGTSTMTSIEKDTSSQHRLEFNKPYSGITLLLGEARDMLSQLSWSDPSIVWLDYTNVLNTDLLRDVDYVVRAATPGSVVIVTVNGASQSPLDNRLSDLRWNLGDLVDPTLSEAAMAGWGPAREQRRVLQSVARAASEDAHGVPIRQLFNFHYSDTCRMQTWGGILSSPQIATQVAACRFEDLPFIREGEDPFEIKVPFLTEKEMVFLEQGIVDETAPMPKLRGITPSDVKSFARMYRWRVGA